MKNKILSLFGLSVFVLVLFVGLGSAAISVSTLGTLDHFGNPQTFKITDPSNVSVSLINQIIEDNGGNTVTISFNETSLYTAPEKEIKVTAIPDSDFFYGSYTTNYVIKEVGTPSNNATLKINFEKTPCEFQDIGNLKIRIDDINVKKGFGKDNDWFPLDEIEVEVEVKNTGNDKIKDIVVEWGLYNKKIGEWIIDDEESDFNLDKGDKETLFITFKLDDADEFENGGDYFFYVWATGKDQKFDGNKTSVSDVEEIEMITDEDDFVILDNLQYPETVQCGQEVQITADVWNVGEEDQEDVSIFVYNKELGISEEVMIGDIDAFEDARIPFSFNFKVPSDAEEKFYTIKLSVYDKKNKVYENDYDDKKSEFIAYLKVSGNCVVVQPVSVSASLESGGKAGEEMVVKVTVTNTGSKAADYTLKVAKYSGWASLISVAPDNFTLNKGESKEVLITFDVKKDVSGEQSFDIEILSGGQLVATKPVSVSIERSGLFSLTGGLISEENWYLWGLGAFNILLIIVIIFVAVRVARKRE